MNNNKSFKLLLSIFIITLAGCNSAQSGNEEMVDDIGVISEKSTTELIKILERAGDTNDPAGVAFWDVIKELEKRGQSASDAAPALAKAITYPRRDSGMAGIALISMGESAKSAIPILAKNLDHERADVRENSSFILGNIGNLAECSVPKLGNLLWDKDPAVRSTAATAIEAITNIDLIEDDYHEIDPKGYGSAVLDEPEGTITQYARTWWVESGQFMKWSNENCGIVE